MGWGRTRFCVWVPTTRMEEPSETRVPSTVMPGSAGLRVVPSTIMASEDILTLWPPTVMSGG